MPPKKADNMRRRSRSRSRVPGDPAARGHRGPLAAIGATLTLLVIGVGWLNDVADVRYHGTAPGDDRTELIGGRDDSGLPPSRAALPVPFFGAAAVPPEIPAAEALALAAAATRVAADETRTGAAVALPGADRPAGAPPAASPSPWGPPAAGADRGSSPGGGGTGSVPPTSSAPSTTTTRPHDTTTTAPPRTTTTVAGSTTTTATDGSTTTTATSTPPTTAVNLASSTSSSDTTVASG